MRISDFLTEYHLIVPTPGKTKGRVAPSEKSPLTDPGTAKWRKMKDAPPGSEEWFKAWFSLPFMTGR
jgi:hypothetical protein